MAEDSLPPDERPWQFSLLHLFGLTTVVSVCAAAFYWSREIGTLVSCGSFLGIATYYHTKAFVRTAAPTLRSHSLPSLVGFGIITSAVACFAPFIVTCAAVMSFSSGAPWSASAFFLGMGCVLGSLASLYVLSRCWPRRPRP